MVQVAKKSNGREGYRKPDAKRDRLSFKLSADQLNLVKRHAFDESEVITDTQVSSELLHRILERLVKEDVSPRPDQSISIYPRVTGGFNLYLTPEVSDLIQTYWQGSGQATADLLITSGALLTPVQGIHSSDEALKLLQVFARQRVAVRDAIELLMQRSSRRTALKLLEELVYTEKVRAIDVQGRCPDKRIELPSGRRLAYIEIV